MQISVFYMLKMDKHTQKKMQRGKNSSDLLFCVAAVPKRTKCLFSSSAESQRHSSCLAIFFVLPAKGAFVAKVILCVTLGYFVERAKAPAQRA